MEAGGGAQIRSDPSDCCRFVENDLVGKLEAIHPPRLPPLQRTGSCMVSRLWLASLASLSLLAAQATAATPDFSRDVRPILSDHCFACHGPDEKERKADLRLDSSDGLTGVVKSSDSDASELLDRILSDDPDEMMPPAEFHKPLSPAQKAILQNWVESGAEFQQHWAFVAPIRPEIPRDTKTNNQSPIDYFIARGAAEAGLELNEIADRRTLLRRVCLDLTGLPPTRQQIEDFLSDNSPDAYDKLVDRLLESPDYGQHVGRYWLDLVRYGDTHGLHLDNYREMWPYRDWVIDAFNANMSFDEFIKRQLAGDLLPDATDADKIASGFNRLNVTTNEGGSIYDEVFARNVIDRTDAFGTIFLGLTAGCAVCHDHKFDPISSQDYYSLSAFFNSLDGLRDGRECQRPRARDNRSQRRSTQATLRVRRSAGRTSPRDAWSD